LYHKSLDSLITLNIIHQIYQPNFLVNSNVNSSRHGMVPWFNAECVQPKKEFFKLRKQYKQNKTDAYLRISLLYANIKKKCKYRYMYHVNVSPTRPTGTLDQMECPRT